MAIADYFTKANNGVDAVPTTLTSTLTPGGTTATINAATGWPVDATDGPVHFTCFKAGVDGKVTAGTQTFYKATLTGTTLSNITRTGGSSVTTFENGDPAIVYFTPAWANDIVAGIKVAHDQDGTLKAGAVDNAAVLANDVVETAAIKDKAVTLPKINGGSTAGVLTTDASGNVSSKGNYSTSEVSTNTTWVDGKAIYKKTINFGALPNNTTKSVAHGITGLTWVIDIEGSSYDSSARITIPYATTSPVWAYVDATNVTIVTTSNRTTFTNTYITIAYTK